MVLFNLVVTCVSRKKFGGPSIKSAIHAALERGKTNDIEALFDGFGLKRVRAWIMVVLIITYRSSN